jgi:hypothetical protein
MGKRIERLKSDFVRKAPVGLHCDGGGLYLRVSEGANNTSIGRGCFGMPPSSLTLSANGASRRADARKSA